MSLKVSFDNWYARALNETNKNLDTDKKIFDEVKSELKFSYGDVDLSKFGLVYKERGWINGRKVVAIPMMLWTGVVKTTYHFASVVIASVATFTLDTQYLKAKAFYIARDFQETLGWFSTIFSDKMGQYHLQESAFHKLSYDTFLNKKATPHIPQDPQQLAQDHQAYLQSLDQLDEYKQREAEQKALDVVATTLNTFKSIRSEKQRNEMKLLEEAETLFIRKDLEGALNTINEIYWLSEVKFKFLVKLARSYMSAHDEARAFKIIKDISDELFKDQFNMYPYVVKFDRESTQAMNALVKDYLQKIAATCIRETKELFTQNNGDKIYQKISEIATSEATIQALFRFEPYLE